MIFPDPKPGDYLTAEMLNVLYDAIKSGVSVVPPLFVTSEGEIALGEEPGFWIQFTGAPASGKHPWKEVFAQPGGTWTDAVRSGTTTDDGAREINGSVANLTTKRARAWRDRASYEVRFHFSDCT